MHSAFLKEQRWYSRAEISFLLEEESLIPRLLSLGILTAKDSGFVCSFVGVAVIGPSVLKCYPKYLPDGAEPVEEMREMLKVLERCGKQDDYENVYGNDLSGKLKAILFLLTDYFENGPYTESKEIRETNGCGEIDWDRTINSTFTLLDKGVPCYPTLITRRQREDEGSYLRSLHECIVTKASKELEDAGLLTLFDITLLDVSEKDLSDFGDRDEILYRIERKLNAEFNTRRGLVLKAMADYLNEEGGLASESSITLYGTPSFYHIWELCTAEVLGNMLGRKLSLLPLPLPLKAAYDRDSRLSDIIEHPLWDITGKRAGDTLIPDMITIRDKSFLIFDAKYYTPSLEEGKPPVGQPGIEAVTKQYLYQLSYQDFITAHGFEKVRNCFLLPSPGTDIEDKGSVRLSFLEHLGLEPILVRLVPATLVFSLYLKGERLSIDLLFP